MVGEIKKGATFTTPARATAENAPSHAILSGERNPFTLARLRHERIKASEEVIAKSLVGDYRIEHLFTLRQSLTAYRSY
jgi:hypothetical protein